MVALRPEPQLVQVSATFAQLAPRQFPATITPSAPGALRCSFVEATMVCVAGSAAVAAGGRGLFPV